MVAMAKMAKSRRLRPMPCKAAGAGAGAGVGDAVVVAGTSCPLRQLRASWAKASNRLRIEANGAAVGAVMKTLAAAEMSMASQETVWTSMPGLRSM